MQKSNEKSNDVLNMIKAVLAKGGPLVALILMMIFLTIRCPSFLTADNILNVFRQSSSQALIAIALMLAILTGGIDLAVGSTMALATVVMGKCLEAGFPSLLCAVVCVVAGLALGWLNGIILTKLKLPHPFISTLGTQFIYRGICLVLTQGTPISGMPPAVKWAGSTFVGPIAVSVIIIIIIYIIFGVFFSKSTLGRHIYAVGGNRDTAKLAGVNVDFTLTAVYTLGGLMCGIAGLILAGRVDAIAPMAGVNWETDAIAAVIVGGASFFGGKGNISGTFVGVMLIAVLRNGLNLLAITPDMQTVILGSVIILSVFIDVVRNGGFKKVRKLAAN